MIKTVLVAIDGSTHSKRALEFACGIAAKYEAALHLLHVTQQPMSDHVLTLGAASVMVSGSKTDLKRAGRQVIDAASEIAKKRGCKTVTTDITSGDPAKRIIDSAKELGADMIVMGSRGLSELSGILMGSVSHKVTHLAKCTCVTVK
jgi:nucleotide-binding universal stress UspA family protein